MEILEHSPKSNLESSSSTHISNQERGQLQQPLLGPASFNFHHGKEAEAKKNLKRGDVPNSSPKLWRPDTILESGTQQQLTASYIHIADRLVSLLGEKSTIGMQCHTLQENCILLALLLCYIIRSARRKGKKRVAFISSSMMDGALLNQAKKLSTTVKWNFLKRKKEERSRRRRKN